MNKKNIVIIGMPGSGKSTVSRILGRRLGFPVKDVDVIVREKAGMEIPDIFAIYGETYFRDLESEVTYELANGEGQIISTGGGTVLRPENVSALKKTGRLFLLDRPLEYLRPAADRPLGDTEDKVKRLYTERDPIYRAAADEVIDVRGSAEMAAEEIISRLHGVG